MRRSAGVPCGIPDAVYIEATRIHGAPGAEQIVAWINANLDVVQIVPTDIGIDQQRRLEEGQYYLADSVSRRQSRHSNGILRSDPAAEALLLFEDSDIEKRRAVVLDQRVGLISTGDFLRELEAAGYIQSTDYILDQAAAQGRNVPRRRQVGEVTTTRGRLRQQFTRRGDRPQPE